MNVSRRDHVLLRTQNTSQLNIGVWSGDIKLRNLRLKTSALDKFRLPIDVKEGYLGDLTLSIPWSNLKGKPVRVLVENVYLLAAPKGSSGEVDEEEEEERAQAAKQEKLESAELLGRSGQAGGMSSGELHVFLSCCFGEVRVHGGRLPCSTKLRGEILAKNAPTLLAGSPLRVERIATKPLVEFCILYAVRRPNLRSPCWLKPGRDSTD